MNLFEPSTPTHRERRPGISYDLVAFILLALGGIFAVSYLLSTDGASIRLALESFFSLSSEQAMWYLTRAAGIMAYLLLWLSTVWGLVIPSKLFGEVLSGEFSFDFHKFISLFSLGFLAVHIFVLTADRYLPFSVAQILVPFIAPYRPLWVGIGIIAFYLTLLVTVTFYLRKQIGKKAFRVIHYTSLVAYFAAVVHALMAGTDSSLTAMRLLYMSTSAVVVFLTVYWLVKLWVSRSGASKPLPIPSSRTPHRT
jgi:methionine sulfoxide reductase heme-binding subunit